MRDGNQQKTWWQKALRWPVFLIFNLALLLFVGISTVRETYRGYSLEKEIASLESKADSLEAKKMKLVQLTESLATPEKVEYEARARLGWKKPGETVYVMQGFEAAGQNPAADIISEPKPLEESNPRLWFKYFFEPDKM